MTDKPVFRNEAEKMEWFAERFECDPYSGRVWKKGKVGSIAEHPNRHRVIQVGGRSNKKFWTVNCRVHRFIFWSVTGSLPDEVDHINRDPSDNSISNLRAATRAENARNKDTPVSNHSSGHKNITWYKAAGKWVVKAHLDGKSHYAGCFTDLSTAIEVRDKLVTELHGEFACLS